MTNRINAEAMTLSGQIIQNWLLMKTSRESGSVGRLVRTAAYDRSGGPGALPLVRDYFSNPRPAPEIFDPIGDF
jgi:hypothetical protein